MSEAYPLGRFIPPLSNDLVRKSPNVAPNGRVKIKAMQNSKMSLRRVIKCSATTRPITLSLLRSSLQWPQPNTSDKSFFVGVRMLSRRRIGEHIPSSAQCVDVHVGVGILHALAYAMNKDFDRVRSDLLPVTINRLFDGGFRHYPIGTPE